MKRAFTLIELLIVIAIVAIIIAILIPALKQTREQVRRTDCLTRLYEFQTVAHDMADWAGSMPIAHRYATDDEIRTLWEFPKDLLRCPSDPYPELNYLYSYTPGSIIFESYDSLTREQRATKVYKLYNAWWTGSNAPFKFSYDYTAFHTTNVAGVIINKYNVVLWDGTSRQMKDIDWSN